MNYVRLLLIFIVLPNLYWLKEAYLVCVLDYDYILCVNVV